VGEKVARERRERESARAGARIDVVVKGNNDQTRPQGSSSVWITRTRHRSVDRVDRLKGGGSRGASEG
jgi:hypothetical protein